MSVFRFSQIATALDARMIGDDVQFELVSSDSRHIQPGELFIALTGPHFDGHDFITQVKEKGAVGALVSRPVDVDFPQLLVHDTLQGLTELSRLRRAQYDIPVIGLTGSCGKTTTKMLLSNILQQVGPTLSPPASLNNHIGVPLTLMRLQSHHQFAVIEMGANHIGEIAHLTGIARPTVATITTVKPVHIEGFGSLEGVFQGKSEIFSGLSQDGIAVLNQDERYFSAWQQLCAAHPQCTFAESQSADVYAKNIHLNQQDHLCFTLCIGNNCTDIHTQLLGEHNVTNALAAAACAHSVGVDLHTIQRGLNNVQAFDKRLQQYQGQCGATLLDDSYNANPESVTAAVSVLMRRPGKHICLLGEMLELGEEAAKIHADMGQLFRNVGVDHVFTVGELTQYTVTQFGKGAEYFTDRQALINTVKLLLASDVTVLIKGSKRNRMWEFTEALSAVTATQEQE